MYLGQSRENLLDIAYKYRSWDCLIACFVTFIFITLSLLFYTKNQGETNLLMVLLDLIFLILPPVALLFNYLFGESVAIWWGRYYILNKKLGLGVTEFCMRGSSQFRDIDPMCDAPSVYPTIH